MSENEQTIDERSNSDGEINENEEVTEEQSISYEHDDSQAVDEDDSNSIASYEYDITTFENEDITPH